MSVSQPGDRIPVGAQNSSGMRLPLHTGDQNGNAFPVSSSSSSSSPDSLRSLSSLSGGRTDSPLDVDMLDMVTTENKMAAVCPAEDDLAEPESNDYSVSVYLDAADDEDTWNDNITLSITGVQKPSNSIHGDLSNGAGGRRGSSPDSEATEMPGDDDDDDDEEESFLSVSSDMVVRRTSLSPSDLDRQPSSSCSILGESDAVSPSGTITMALTQEPLSAPLPDLCEGLEGRNTTSTTDLQSKGSTSPGLPDEDMPQVVADLPEEVCPLDLTVDVVEPREGQVVDKEPGVGVEVTLSETMVVPDSEGFTDMAQTSTSVQGSGGVEFAASPLPMSLSPNEGTEGVSPTPRKTKGPPGGARAKPPTVSAAAKTTVSTATKPSKPEVKRFPKPDLKNVKSKIISRPAAPPRTANQVQGKAAPANEKKAPPRKKEGQADGVKRQRSTSSHAKMAMLKPGPKPRPHQNRESRVSSQSEKRRKGTVAHGTRSSSSSSLGSEVTVDGPERTPGEGVQDTLVPNEGESTGEGTGDQTPAEPRRRNGMKVSSKLGPRQQQQQQLQAQVKGRGAGGASSTGGPTLLPSSPAAVGGSPGTRLLPPASSQMGKDGQSPGSGSPPRGRQSQPVGIPKPRVTERPSGLAAPATVTSNPKTSVNPGLGAARPTAAVSKLPVKGLSTSLSSSSLGSVASETNGAPAPSKVLTPAPVAPASGGCKAEERPSRTIALGGTQGSVKPPSTTTTTTITSSSTSKAPGVRNRTTSLPGRSTATGLKTPTVTNQVTAKQQTQNPLQRNGSARLSRPAAGVTVDKNKLRGAPARTTATSATATPGGVSHQPQSAQPPDLVPVPAAPVTTTTTTTPGSGSGSVRVPAEAKPATLAQYRDQCEKKNQCIVQLRKLLGLGNRRIEALATVLQHIFTEREEALKQKKELSLELANLRDELLSSTQNCDRLQHEKEEARGFLEEALRRVQEHHQGELSRLEESLRAFYQAEWDKVHLTYQEEADRYRSLMEQQVEELRTKQEALRKEQEVSHSEQMETLKQQYDTSIQELRNTQEQDMENLDKTLKETETSLSEKIHDLTMENEALSEKLREEEERRRILAEKSQKDSHTLYLEQELESLKVVLEIKNQQLHQQDKKLMQMDKLMETNVKLEECLNKVQQENEDYRARMDKHQALSKQLSSEQVMLQQTLQKESKANKRLSMENEELQWKLHNGDLASPRRLSPTSTFPSPRNSASFPSSAPLSPR